jgi:hypothetical protein
MGDIIMAALDEVTVRFADEIQPPVMLESQGSDR